MQHRGRPDRQSQRHQERDEGARHQQRAEGQPAQAVALLLRSPAAAYLHRRGRREAHGHREHQAQAHHRVRTEGSADAHAEHHEPAGREPPALATQGMVAHQPRHHQEDRHRAGHPGGGVQGVERPGQLTALQLSPPRLTGVPDRGESAADRGDRHDPAHRVRPPAQDERRDRPVDAGHGHVDDQEPQVLVQRRSDADQHAQREQRQAPGDRGDRRGHPGPGRGVRRPHGSGI